jgi:hypothetical protein
MNKRITSTPMSKNNLDMEDNLGSTLSVFEAYYLNPPFYLYVQGWLIIINCLIYLS